MYWLCVEYDEAKLEALADQKGYANSNEMCEDLMVSKSKLLNRFVPIDVTTETLDAGVYTHNYEAPVYAHVRVNEAEFVNINSYARVWPAGSYNVVWVDEQSFADGRVVIPLQNL